MGKGGRADKNRRCRNEDKRDQRASEEQGYSFFFGLASLLLPADFPQPLVRWQMSGRHLQPRPQAYGKTQG